MLQPECWADAQKLHAMRMKTSTPIALLTDFGTEDGYVGSMKGVILSIAPSACIIDISHAVRPQNIDQASYLLWSVFTSFPKKTVFITVVDPGVGTQRRILCVETGSHVFLAPDFSRLPRGMRVLQQLSTRNRINALS
jgi:S-adenosyl-L-methionine hydrolase (adenosine-forming)